MITQVTKLVLLILHEHLLPPQSYHSLRQSHFSSRSLDTCAVKEVRIKIFVLRCIIIGNRKKGHDRNEPFVK